MTRYRKKETMCTCSSDGWGDITYVFDGVSVPTNKSERATNAAEMVRRPEEERSDGLSFMQSTQGRAIIGNIGNSRIINLIRDIIKEQSSQLKKYINKNMELYLSELIGRKADLVMKTALKPTIEKHILKEVVYI